MYVVKCVYIYIFTYQQPTKIGDVTKGWLSDHLESLMNQQIWGSDIRQDPVDQSRYLKIGRTRKTMVKPTMTKLSNNGS